MPQRSVLLPSRETECEWIWATSVPEEDTPVTDGEVGKWLLFFDDEGKDNESLTNEGRATSTVVKLAEIGIITNAKASTSINSKQIEGNNRNVIVCYTCDYRNIDDFRKISTKVRNASRLMRTFNSKTNNKSQSVSFKRSGYHHVSLYKLNPQSILLVSGGNGEYIVPEWTGKCGGSANETECILPSNVTYKEWISARKGDPYRILHNKGGGKWIIPLGVTSKDSNGLTKLDRAWQKILNLIRQGELLTAQCSTPVASENTGVIFCHTYNYEDVEDVKRVANNVRKSFHMLAPIYYKINSSSDDQICHVLRSSCHITKYKHTVRNQLLVRSGNVWIPIDETS